MIVIEEGHDLMLISGKTVQTRGTAEEDKRLLSVTGSFN